MKIETTRFGNLEIKEEKIITFPRGIPGFENVRRFFLLPVEGLEDIHWLQAVENPGVALLVIDPFKYFIDYSFEIPGPDLEELEITEQAQVLVIAVVTIPGDDPALTTANLLAPVIINTRTSRARQIILNGLPYTTRHRLFPDMNSSSEKKKCNVSGGEGK
ncbi:flagellar assembly factor FliW [Desulfocucumis palustris]|uniref:Flagellar assembly factor FliW n=1 Tax=Desulfocucumis palustris TaxID=1898651 RepID=A0A2L2X8N1_9FIRM|nr:flagellar assembly protein FliW [Desulfocucumis palustris]GBF32284.1 flagellar assembly factor FliW [Desulfocucumis palustris]